FFGRFIASTIKNSLHLHYKRKKLRNSSSRFFKMVKDKSLPKGPMNPKLEISINRRRVGYLQHKISTFFIHQVVKFLIWIQKYKIGFNLMEGMKRNISASSCTTEQTFSSVADVCSTNQGKLLPMTIEICVRSHMWLKNGVQLLGDFSTPNKIINKFICFKNSKSSNLGLWEGLEGHPKAQSAGIRAQTLKAPVALKCGHVCGAKMKRDKSSSTVNLCLYCGNRKQ
ncbi:hypothetical protein VP01_4606g1, partial [Puccinia sorghi]